MKRIILFLCIFFTSFIAPGYASDDITSPGFKIDLGRMDPLASDRAGAIPAPGMGSLYQIINTFSNLFLVLMPIIAVASLIIAGYYYLLSGGDSEKATKAKTIIKWNIVAIIVALGSYSMIRLIYWILNT